MKRKPFQQTTRQKFRSSPKARRRRSRNLRSRLFPYGGALVVAGLLIWGFGELTRKPAEVEAIETGASRNQAAVGSWQSASFPVENFQAYTSPFGYRQSPYSSGQQFHYGLDIAAPSGSYVRNWWTGRVVEVSDESACGASVVVQSGEWTHIYCHMQGQVGVDQGRRFFLDREGGLQIWEGQQISSGARIGRVGMTGRTTGPHLHWGLKFRGSWVDPAWVLQAMYSEQTASK